MQATQSRASWRARAISWLVEPQHAYGVAALAVLALSTFMRLHGIDRDALWLDEGYSWWDAQQTLANLWALVPQCDPHPPLYFLLLKGWITVFGDSVTTLRLPSALIGILTTGVVILAGREIRRPVGILAGLMFAVTPFQIEFSHEARPYALLCLGAALLTLAGLRLARRIGQEDSSPVLITEGRPTALFGDLALLVAGGALMLWTNDTSVLFVFAAGAAFTLMMMFDRGARRYFRWLALAFVAMVVLWLPNLPLLLEQAAEVSSDFWIQRPEGWRIANELRFLVSVSVFAAVWWSVATMAGSLALMHKRGRWREALVLGCLIVLPVLLNWSISMTIKPIYLARALIAIAPPVCVVLASSVLLLSTRGLRRVGVAALVAMHLAGLYVWHTNYNGKERWDSLAMQIVHGADHAPHGDAMVLVTANELALPLAHAFEDVHAVGLPVTGIPANFPAPGMDARYPSGKCAPSLQGLDLESVRRAVAGHHTVFFITRKDNVYDPGSRVVKALRALGMTERSYRLFVPGYLEVHTFVDAGAKGIGAASAHASISHLPSAHFAAHAGV